MNVRQTLKSLAGLKSCPNEQQLAAYAEQQVIGAERSLVETHLGSCDRCLKQVSFLVRSRSMGPEEVPKELMKAAMEIGRRDGRKQVGWQWLVAGAATAAILAALATMKGGRQTPSVATETVQTAQRGPAEGPPVTTHESESGEEKVRGADPTDQEAIISPKRNEKLDPNQADFRWKAAKDALYYEVQVVSENGDVVWQQRTVRMEARLATSAKLEKGRVYYVWVKAYLARGAVEQSKAVRFTVQ